MTMIRRLRSVPVTYRVPAIVALLMVVISAVISEHVLDRLSRTQEGYLNGLAETYLDGLSSAVIPSVLRGDVWEVFDALDRSKSSYAALSPVETVVTGSDGRILAATDPTRMATFSQLPDSYLSRYGPGVVTIDESALTGFAKRDLIYQGQPVGTIHATFDVSRLFAERREILFTLLVTNGLLAVLFSLGGFLIVRQMIAPMRVLENHMRLGAAKSRGSGMAGIEDKVRGLGFGADDYMTKPFHKDELVARIHAIVRRSKGHAQSVITTGDLVVNLDAKTVEVGGQRVHLTGKEYQMLELLSLRKGTTLTKEMFLNHLYGGMDEPELKIIDVFICKLRKKLDAASGGQNYIETVWGRGYVLREPEDIRVSA
jgi:DNA-binding winged helix-turn-helix (wHTH) protein